MKRTHQLLPAALFFLSGCASLIFETLCSRRLALVMGSTVQSASATVSGFLFGLGVGAYLGSKIIRRNQNPVLVFAMLEGFAGLGALGVLALIPHLPSLLAPVAQGAPGLLPVVRVLLVFLLLLLPACAMGASLPVLSHYYVERLQKHFASSLGLLYAVNTLGAATGVIVTDFFMVERIGVTKTGWVSGGLYFLVALLALGLTRFNVDDESGASPPSAVRSDETQLDDASSWSGPLALATSGFCGLTLQVLWTRMLTFFNGNDIFAFSTTLAVYLVGLVVGSFLIGKFAERMVRVDLVLGLLLCAFGFTAYLSLFSLTLVRGLREALVTQGVGLNFSVFLSGGLVMLPSTICLGCLFPVAAQKLKVSGSRAADAVGRAYVLNTLGSVLGALVAGFFLLPTLGLQASLKFTTMVSTLAGGLIMLRGKHFKSIGLLAPLALSLLLWLTPSNFLLKTVYSEEYESIVYSVDDHYGSIALTRAYDPTLQQVSENFLVDGFNMAGNTPTARRYTVGLAALPILLTESPKKVLIVCMGLGNTLDTALSLKQTETVQCVELSARVPEMLRMTEIGPKVLSSPKLKVELGDGRNHLLFSDNRYDVISAEPPPPTHAGIVNLYSREYYELCSSKLNEGGIVAQWLPVFQLSTFETQTIIAAFQDVFPYTYLWESAGSQLVLLGKKEPLNLDYQRLVSAVELNKDFLSESGWDKAPYIAALSIAGPEQLREYTKGIPPLTDDWPRIQYSDHDFWIDKNFFYFSPRVRDLNWQATAAQKEEIERFRKASLAFHVYANQGDKRYPELSLLEIYDLARLTMEVMPGDKYYQTRFLVTPGVLAKARQDSLDNPANAAAFHEVSRNLFINGDDSAALEAAQKAAALPSSKQQFYKLFEVLVAYRSGDTSEARKLFERLQVRPTKDFEYLGKLIKDKDKTKETKD